MPNFKPVFLATLLAAASFTVFADDDKDESGNDRKYRQREHKTEYRDGNCKVEREYKKNGDYKEERKCKGAPRGYYSQAEPVYIPQPVYIQAPPAIYVEPGIFINGTFRVSP